MSVLLYSFAAVCLLGVFIYLNKYSYWRKIYFKACNNEFGLGDNFKDKQVKCKHNLNYRAWAYHFKKVNLNLAFSLTILTLLFILVNVLHIEGNITDIQTAAFILFITSGIAGRKTLTSLREHWENQTKPYYNPSLSYMGSVLGFALITILSLVLGVIFLLS
ncbi:MAG: hypothetical protein IBX57_00660 [Gammaproteobacteria bacterium]|nr:hypothetical protein [Gammaproteobacteria bacterium]